MTTILLFCSIVAVAQNANHYKNSLGVDVANILTFLSKKRESCLINYKHHCTEYYALRSGLNLDWSTAMDGYKSIGIRLGYERNTQMVAQHWKLHYGADALVSYLKRNYMPNTYFRCGISPLIGFSFFPVTQFSLSTEAGINFFYTDYCNPQSNVPQDNENTLDVNIGYVGMLIVGYHF